MRRTPGKHIKISYCDRLHSEGSLLKFEVKAGKFGASLVAEGYECKIEAGEGNAIPRSNVSM